MSAATTNAVASLRRIAEAATERDVSTAIERKRLLLKSRENLNEAKRLIHEVLANI